MRSMMGILVLGVFLVVACGGGPSVGAACSAGQESCDGNIEWECESGKWKIGEDCNMTKKKCALLNDGKNAECQ